MEPMTASAAATAAAVGYADSVDSSPRSRGGDSWDEPFTAGAAFPSKIRLMCSYGGRIVPRPTDKSLCYLGGDTRIIAIDRQSSLNDVHARLSRTIFPDRSFILKYQLPNEDLDSLISLTTDEDLENMIDECDRLNSSGNSKSSRIRLFLFPTKPDSSTSAPSSINSLLDDSKSESWFVDALNGAMAAAAGGGLPRGLSEDSASVNCLLGLDDDRSNHSRSVSGSAATAAVQQPVLQQEQVALTRPDSSGRLASVTDSPIVVETASSFESNSSVPSLSNLPPIRVWADDRPPDMRFENQFAHMNISSGLSMISQQQQQLLQQQRIDAVYSNSKEGGYGVQQPPPPSSPLPTNLASPPTISPTENSSRVFSSEDDKVVTQLPIQPQIKSGSTDGPDSESIPSQQVYYHERVPSTGTVSSSPVLADVKREAPVSDPNHSVRTSQFPEQSYVIAPQAPVQHDQLHQQQQQQQFIQASPHFVHHPATGTMVPMPPYYQVAHPMQQSQTTHLQQVPMYYMPVQANTAYNMPVQTNLSDANTTHATGKPAVAVQNTALPPRTKTRTAAMAPAVSAVPPLMHVSATDQVHSFPPLGYHMLHHHPSQSIATMPNSMAAVHGYGYEYSDPMRAQMLYAQSTTPGQVPSQYHPVSSASPAISDPNDVKPARAAS